MAGNADENRKSFLLDYVQILSKIIRDPKSFYSDIDTEPGWKRPTRVLLLSGLFFAVASAIVGMPQNPGATMLIGFANAFGMVVINACLGYMVMVFTQKKPVPFYMIYCVYAYAAGAVLTFAWMPYLLWLTEPWRWWLIGCGLTKGCGLTVKSTVMIILLSWFILMLLFWSIFPVSGPPDSIINPAQ